MGKAKAIIKSKVYKIDRREALQKAVDLFGKVKDRLSMGVLDDLKIASQKRKKSETITNYDGSTRLERNDSLHEDLNRNILDSIILNRQRLVPDIITLSEPSEKSDSKSSEDIEYCGNLWSRNRLSSTSTSSFQPVQSKYPSVNCANFEYPRATPCISPPLPIVTPLYQHSVQTSNSYSVTPSMSPPLPSKTPLYTSRWDRPPLPEKSPEPNPPIPDESAINNDRFIGHYPTPNVHLDELESIQDTLRNLGNFENYDGKSSDSGVSENATKRYYYLDGELTEFTPPRHDKPNQSVSSAGTSQNSSKSENDEFQFPKLTVSNVAKFMDMLKPAEKVSKCISDDIDEKLKLLYKKVEVTKRKIDDVDDKKEDPRNPKKTKTESNKKVKKVAREKKLYVKESSKIEKIVKKYEK
jgi:hypothetical protein